MTDRRDTVLKRPQRLIDYVLTLGLGDSFMKTLERRGSKTSQDGDRVSLSTFLSHSFSAEILHKAPLSIRKDFELPDTVPLFVFPDGIRILQHRPRTKVHSFVMTKLDGGRFYGFCVVKYNQISKRKRNLMKKTVEKSHEIHSDGGSTFYVPTSLCILSHYPMQLQFFQFFVTLCEVLPGKSKFGSGVIHRTFSLLSAKYPKEGGTNITIGRNTIHFPDLQDQSRLATGLTNFAVLSRCLSDELIVEIFVQILSEGQIIFVSNHMFKLTVCIECFSTLMRPFEWPFVYIPLLPKSLLDFFQAPMPFIIGVHRSFLRADDLPTEPMFVDLDNNRLYIPRSKKDKTPAFPDQYRLKLLRIMSMHAPYAVGGGGDTGDDTSSTHFSRTDDGARGSVVPGNVPMPHPIPRKKSDGTAPSSFGPDSLYTSSPAEPKFFEYDVLMELEDHEVWQPPICDGDTQSDGVSSDTCSVSSTESNLGDSSHPMPASSSSVSSSSSSKLEKSFMNFFVSIFKMYRQFLRFPSPESDLEAAKSPSDFFDVEHFLEDFPEDVVPFLTFFLETMIFQVWVQRRLQVEEKDYFEKAIAAKLEAYALKLSIFASTTRRGYLLKQGRVRKTWKKRYFEISGLVLSYFVDNQEEQLKGKLVLIPGETRVIVPPPLKGQPTQFIFAIVMKSRTLYCCTENSEDRRLWVQLLRAKVMDETQREELVQQFMPNVPVKKAVFQVREEPFFNSGMYFAQVLGVRAKRSGSALESQESKDVEEWDDYLSSSEEDEDEDDDGVRGVEEMDLS